MTSTSSMAAFTMGAMGEQSQTLELVGRIGGSLQALVAMIARLPPTPLAPGGEAEAALLRHHLSACGKLREAQSISTSLLQRPFVVAPGEKIYMDPTVVPTLLSTRANSDGGCELSAPTRSRQKDAARNALPVPEAGSLQSGVKKHSSMCESLAKSALASMTDIVSGKRPPPAPPLVAIPGTAVEALQRSAAPQSQESSSVPKRLKLK